MGGDQTNLFPGLLLVVLLTSIAYGYDLPANEVSSNKVLEQIRKGLPVEYDHYTINGNLDLNELNSSSINNSLKPVIASPIIITESTINGLIDFSGAVFQEAVAFRKTKVNGELNFHASAFNKSVDFSGSKLGDDSEFTELIFRNRSSFDEVEFGGDAKFSSSVFNENAQFSQSKFKETADFEKAIFYKNAHFDKCQFSEAYFEGASFMEHLDLNKTTYNKFYVNWNDISNNLNYSDLAITLLIENFRKMGLARDANECYYNYRKWRFHREYLSYMQTHNPSDLLAAEVDGAVLFISGWGTKPFFPIIWSIIVISIFTIMWHNILNKPDDFIDEYSLHYNKKPKFSILDSFRFSFYLFLSGSTINILKPPPPPDLPSGSKEHAKSWYDYERALGGIFTFFISIYLAKIISFIS